jgi:hypothetical protein
MTMRSISIVVLIAMAFITGCASKKHYGVEQGLYSPIRQRQVWAVAPAINLSGQEYVDPILQADIVYQQLQQVRGITAIPVNRVAEVYASLRIEQLESEEQAELVCELLGCDALLVPTVTAYDPYNPPKQGASLQLFLRKGSVAQQAKVDPRQLSRQARGGGDSVALPTNPGFIQAVGMFDAANGSVREALFYHARGRSDPTGPLAENEYLVNMDRYSGFVYQSLIAELLNSQRLRR